MRDKQVAFYDGCIVIEVHDYRLVGVLSLNSHNQIINTIAITNPRTSSILSDSPEIHRVLLRPNEASIAADIKMYLDLTLGDCLWSDEQYLEMEKGIRVNVI